MRYRDLVEGRVDELVGVKKFAGMNHLEIMDYINDFMRKGQVKVLGHGGNALALQIGQAAYKFWFRDSAYEDFVKYATAHQQNPMMPRFLSGIKEIPAFFIRSKEAPDRVRYVKVELLESKEPLESQQPTTARW